MSDCTHKYRTIDCFCNDCGSSEVLDLIYDDIRREERERIIKLLEAHAVNYRVMQQPDEADFLDLLIGKIIGSSK